MNQLLMIDARFNELTMREKVLTLISGLVLILFGGFVYLVEPVQLEIDSLAKRVKIQSSELGKLEQQIRQVELELEADPNAPLREKLSTLDASIQDLDEKLREQTVDLIPANKMPVVLEKILGQSKDLKILEMNSIAPIRMMDINAADSSAQVNLFQHGVLLVLEGSYFDIQRYLDEIEHLEWRFYWKRFDYLVQEHPKARVEIELYTLSTSKAFIGV